MASYNIIFEPSVEKDLRSLKNWIPPYQVRGRLNQVRNDDLFKVISESLTKLIHVSPGPHVKSFPCHEIIFQQKHNPMRNLAGFAHSADMRGVCKTFLKRSRKTLKHLSPHRAWSNGIHIDVFLCKLRGQRHRQTDNPCL